MERVNPEEEKTIGQMAIETFDALLRFYAVLFIEERNEMMFVKKSELKTARAMMEPALLTMELIANGTNLAGGEPLQHIEFIRVKDPGPIIAQRRDLFDLGCYADVQVQSRWRRKVAEKLYPEQQPKFPSLTELEARLVQRQGQGEE